MLLNEFVNYRHICPACNKNYLTLSLKGKRILPLKNNVDNYPFNYYSCKFRFTEKFSFTTNDCIINNDGSIITSDKVKDYLKDSQKSSLPYHLSNACSCGSYFYSSDNIVFDSAYGYLHPLNIRTECLIHNTDNKIIKFVNYFRQNFSAIESFHIDPSKQMSLFNKSELVNKNSFFDFKTLKNKIDTYLTFI